MRDMLQLEHAEQWIKPIQIYKRLGVGMICCRCGVVLETKQTLLYLQMKYYTLYSIAYTTHR